MEANALLQIDLFSFSRPKAVRVEVQLCGHRWFLDKAVLHGLGQRVIADDIFEGDGPSRTLDERRGRPFQSQKRF